MGDWLRAHGTFALVLVALIGLLVWGLLHRHILDSFDLLIFAAFVPGVIFHEVSHGVVALWCGDDTAKQAGRLTLNPIKHVDPVGSVILPVVLLLSPAHRVFGWAKPVPVRIDRLRHPRNQAVLVGLAGPVTNILLSAMAGVLCHWLYVPFVVRVPPGGTFSGYASLSIGAQILVAFGFLNLFMAAFNLLPVPPLDGSALLERLIPRHLLPGYYRVRMGFLVLVLVLVFLFNQPLADLFGWLQTLWLKVFAGGGTFYTPIG
jgi:Zn-dependent protease